MLVFNLRHMHTLAWKTNMVVFSIIYSRVSWWAFSLQKQMCIEQRYACYLYRKCKSKHLEGAMRLYSRAVKTLKCPFFFHGPQIMSVYSFLSSTGVQHRFTLDDATIQLFYTIPTCTCKRYTHAPPPLLPQFSFNLRHVLFYSTLHLHPPWSHLVSISPLRIPPYHSPAHGLHIPLSVAAPFNGLQEEVTSLAHLIKV